ncbi:hypothetical protein J7T55_007497 [Diaporthe amygdali]|uniref:uncharacterized protein n=1 Tax=Phomopsis amygdali TaxID=1214568 RepID=UPI0022FE76A3|nr:uncharacterized protein J7T55_007497 [Diaporthe amygdali]KAJ0116517.1 hypothetical protein J7T55_007497 [Diaporthe amygdali]
MAKDLTLQYITEVKGNVTAEQAIATLQEHQFFLDTDPNIISSKTDTQPKDGKLHPIPEAIQAIQKGDTRCYEVLDKVPVVALFSKLLPGLATITNHYQITNTKDGIFVYLQAALGVSQERRWAVVEDKDGLRIVEYVTTFCSRLLYESVKGQQEANWKGVHAQYVRKMGGEVGDQSTS